MAIKITSPGLLTLVVDKGRTGYRKYGIPASGAMDGFAYRAANLLVGNNDGEAVMEFSMSAPGMIFTSGAVIAITGADFSPCVNGTPIPMWESVRVREGSELSFGTLKNGCRGYIAFSGGIDVPKVMGSRTTFARAGIGGYKGRALKPGDALETASSNFTFNSRFLNPPVYRTDIILRVILGPQDDHFTKEGIDAFLNKEYKVSPMFDRMGYRLEGPVIKAKSGHDIVSEGIVAGSVQVPGDGKPIIIMEDGQTAGGYAKAATVISSDLPLAAQAKAGDTIRFKAVSINEARAALEQYENNLKQIVFKEIITRRFRIVCNGKVYQVEAWER